VGVNIRRIFDLMDINTGVIFHLCVRPATAP
jgi:hypothetical protein